MSFCGPGTILPRPYLQLTSSFLHQTGKKITAIVEAFSVFTAKNSQKNVFADVTAPQIPLEEFTQTPSWLGKETPTHSPLFLDAFGVSVSSDFGVTYYYKKLRHRRETARQLPTWRGGGLGPPPSPSPPLWLHLPVCMWSNPKPGTNVCQACRPLSAL